MQLVVTKGKEVWATTIKVPNTFAPALQFQVKDGQNTRGYEGIRRVEGPNAHDQSVLCIPFILSGSPNKCWLHTRVTRVTRVTRGNKGNKVN